MFVTSDRNRLPTQCRNSMLRRSPVKRDPYTTRARPFSTGASRRGQSSGSYSRSASCTSTRSPVALSRPVRIAAPLPRFWACFRTRTVLSRSCVRTSAVPSRLPSSTITISRSTGSSTDRIRRTSSATVLRSLKTGTMTDSVRNRFAASSLGPSSLTLPPEPFVGAGETFAEVDLRAPAEHVVREGDVGPAAHRIVDGERLVHDLGARPGDLEHLLCEVEDGELVRVPDVHRTDPVGVEKGEDPAYLVVDVAVGAGLRPVAVHGERLSLHGLDQEVGHDPSVAVAQAGTVRVEDAHDLDVDVVG